MALVSYDYGSDSDDNEETEDSSSQVILNEKPQPIVTNNHLESNDNLYLFSALPQPIKTDDKVIEEVEDEFLNIKEKPTEAPTKKNPVKIGVPDPSEFDSDEEDDNKFVAKRFKPQYTKNGLFTILPPPKHVPLSTTSLVPNVLKRKPGVSKPPIKPPAASQPPVEPSPSKTAALNTTSKEKVVQAVSDSEDEDDLKNFVQPYDDEIWQQVCGRKTPAIKPSSAPKEIETSIDEESYYYPVDVAPPAEKPYHGLDNEAFKQLVGNHKRKPKEIEIIDIHEDEVRPDKMDWLKSLTDPQHEFEQEVEEPVDNTRKVKNHITALAQKALANDKELQIRWSNDRYNRRLTQAKYGF